MDSFIFKRGKEIPLRSRAAIIGGFSLLALAGVSAVVLAFTTATAERWAAHSLEVRQVHTVLFSMVQDAETGQRGYLLTGDTSYLEPYAQARIRIPVLEANLARLVADNSAQRDRLTALRADIDQRMSELERTVSRRKDGDVGGALALLKTNEGRDLMTRIRTESAVFDQAEQQSLAKRQASASLQRSLLVGLIMSALIVAGLLAYLVAAAARRHASEILAQSRALLAERENREQAEAVLREAQKMEALGQLTGGVAHDFNNMLAIIVGNLDLMLRRLADGDLRLRSMAESALSGANRAAALTRRLLAFSRLQPLDPRPTDIN